MAENTAISWCDHTFNGWIGCLKVSPACNGCYAEAMMDKRYGRVTWGAPGQGAGTRVRTSESNWKQPLKWNRKAAETGTRPFVFCSSLSDVFDNQVPTEWRRDLFDLIRQTPNLVWLLLTKRPQLIVRLSEEAGGLPRNAALGTTVEDQERANLNIPHLLSAKAQLQPLFAFLSCEPLLGHISLTRIRIGNGWHDVLGGWRDLSEPYHGMEETIDWVIAGGETDQGTHKARPMHLAWVRDLRDKCAKAGVPFHFKQWGEWMPSIYLSDEQRERYYVRTQDPGAPVKTLVEATILCHDGTRMEFRPPWNFPAGSLPMPMFAVGKKVSGRVLDGVEHNDRPRV